MPNSDITIKVVGNLSTDVQELEKVLERGYKDQTTKMSPGRYRDAKLELEKMKSLASKPEFSKKDLDAFNDSFKKVSAVIDAAAKRAANLTEQAKKLEKAVDDAKTAVNKQEAKVLANKNLKTTAQDTINSYLAKGYTFGKNKNITRVKTLSENKDPSSIPIYNSRGTLINADSKGSNQEAYTEIQAAIAQYTQSVQNSDKLQKQLENKTAALALAQQEYTDQIKSDIATGKSQNAGYLNDVNAATGATHGDIAQMKRNFVDANIANSEAKSADLSGIGNGAQKTTNALGKVIKQISLFQIGMRLMRRAISEVKTTIIDLDKSLTEQAMVTGKTRKEVYQLLKTYQEMAIQLGATTKEVSATMTEFIRQGKSTQEAMMLSEAAISAAKVAAINTSDSINYLTTALNGFQLSAKDAMEVSDKFAAVSANAATSYEEIAIALSKVASQASLAGMSIDYTTALLAKGLETTREAPETIGTALKTVIARMREITDYGETLEDGVDLNNVESQLAYVGIQLRNANGDLRSTEDVLDDLGKKWDILNSNQQAAIAKALAGTRQQSRLIAMMSDYERVVELQEISARSAGATMAQMETYTRGFEAALNRLSTSWEEIIETVVNSDWLIGIVNFATSLLDEINDIVKLGWTMIPIAVLLLDITTKTVIGKIQEHKMNKMILASQLKQRQIALQDAIAQKKATVTKLQEVKLEEQKTKLAEINVKLKALEAKAADGLSPDEQAELKSLTAQRLQLTTEIAQTEVEIQTTTSDIGTLTGALNQNLQSQETLTSGIFSNFFNMLPIVSTILMISNAIVKAKKAEKTAIAAANAEEAKGHTQNGPGRAAKIISTAKTIAGVLAMVALVTGLGIMIGQSIYNAIHMDDETEEDKINNLAASIYTLTKRVEAIKTASSSIEDLDSNLIKTKNDANELADVLDTIADKLSTTKEDNLIQGLDKSEKDYYEELDEVGKRNFLKEYEKESNKKLQELYDDQLGYILGSNNWTEKIRSNARSNAKWRAYNTLDESFSKLTSTETSNARSLLETILDNSSDEVLKDYLTDTGRIYETLTKITQIKTTNNSIASVVLQNEDNSLKDRVAAFKSLRSALGETSDEFKAIAEYYSEFNVFSQWKEDLLDLIEVYDINNKELNDMWKSYDKVASSLRNLGKSENFTDVISEDQYQEGMLKFWDRFEETRDAKASMEYAFGSYLKEIEDSTDAYIAIYNQIANAVQVGILNIGQATDKVKSSVTSIHDVVGKWRTMTEDDKSQFLSSNSELFAGEAGVALLKAIESEDYSQVQKALENNPTLQKNIEALRKQIQAELDFEIGKPIEEQNQAAIEMWRETLAKMNRKDFLMVDIDTLVEQENKRIEAYKELLEKEEDVLTKSLEKRKDAYQKYFDAINDTAEDEDYEEKATLLVSNLSKLAGSNSMASKDQISSLENQLAELEKERLQTLRERAQEAVIQSIDDTIEDISAQFEELLANNREILNLLRGHSGEELVAKLLSQESFAAMTANEATQYLNTIQSTYGSQVSGLDWNNISIDESGNTLVLNVNGQSISLDASKEKQQNIYEAIVSALRQNGINGGI